MGRGPGAVRVEAPSHMGKGDQRRAGQRGHDVERREAERRGDRFEMRPHHGIERSGRLLDMDHALAKEELRPERLARPGEDRIPGCPLLRCEAFGLAGAVSRARS